MQDCLNCTKYYNHKFCADCGSMIYNIDLSINIKAWCLILNETEYNNSKIVIHDKEHLLLNNLHRYNIKLNVEKTFDGKNIPNGIPLESDTTLRSLLSNISHDKMIKLFDILLVTPCSVGFNFILKESLEIKEINHKINTIFTIPTNLYINPETDLISTESEIKEYYKLEFIIFDINIEELYIYDRNVINVKIFIPNSLNIELQRFRKDRLTNNSIFGKLKLKTDIITAVNKIVIGL